MLTIDDTLARIGLQRRLEATDHLGSVVGLFAAGFLVGAGLALLLAPRPGRELRSDLRERLASLRRRAAEGGNGLDLPESPDDVTRAELYELAKELEIEGRSEMTKQQLWEALAQHRH